MEFARPAATTAISIVSHCFVIFVSIIASNLISRYVRYVSKNLLQCYYMVDEALTHILQKIELPSGTFSVLILFLFAYKIVLPFQIASTIVVFKELQKKSKLDLFY